MNPYSDLPEWLQETEWEMLDHWYSVEVYHVNDDVNRSIVAFLEGRLNYHLVYNDDGFSWDPNVKFNEFGDNVITFNK